MYICFCVQYIFHLASIFKFLLISYSPKPDVNVDRFMFRRYTFLEREKLCRRTNNRINIRRRRTAQNRMLT
jgi:hypothetical protein